jgi:glycerophosphoryl diester phosphodiesterase
MLINEEFIKGKKENQLLCEDKIYKGSRFIAIIDGATSKNSRTFDGKSGGLVAAELICSSLSSIEELTPTSPLLCPYKLCDKIRKSFIPFYKKNNIDFENNPEQRIVACAAIYDNLLRKIIFIGDCQAIIHGNNGFFEFSYSKKIDEVTSDARALYLSSILAEGKITIDELKENDLGREFIAPLLKKQLSLQNKDIAFGYECFDGTEIPSNMIKIVDVEPKSMIVLSSDGYPKLFKTLYESEVYLKNILEDDPLLYTKFPSTKGLMKGNTSFDDRAYISFCIK